MDMRKLDKEPTLVNLKLLWLCGAILAAGCAAAETGALSGRNPPEAVKPAPAAKAIPPAAREKPELEVELWQDGKPVKPDARGYLLKPQPFLLHLRGDVGRVSYCATTDPKATAPLEQLKRPLVFFEGTGAATGGAENFCFIDPANENERIELFDATASFFTEKWGSAPADAAENATFLRKVCGQVPAIAYFSHFYFPSSSETENPDFYLKNFRKTFDGLIDGDYVVKTLDDQPVGQVGPVRIILFIDHPIGGKFDFRRMTWQFLDLRFE
jgi:hypothetical protein